MSTLNLQLSNILADLNARSYRHQLISANIANADTPGYYAKDLDFKEALNAAMSNSGRSLDTFIKYRQTGMPSLDGNTVDIDLERTKLLENATMFEFSLLRASHYFKMLETAIKG